MPFSKTMKDHLEQDKTCLTFPLFSRPPYLRTPTVLKPLSPPPVPAHTSLSVAPFLFQFCISIARRRLSIKAGPPQRAGQWESPSPPSQREARLTPLSLSFPLRPVVAGSGTAVMSSGCSCASMSPVASQIIPARRLHLLWGFQPLFISEHAAHA